MSNLNLKDETFLAAALEGLELQRTRIEEQIRQVKGLLGRGGLKRAAEAATAPVLRVRRGKRNLSSAARARIAAAQKRRWAEYRKQKGKSKSEG